MLITLINVRCDWFPPANDVGLCDALLLLLLSCAILVCGGAHQAYAIFSVEETKRAYADRIARVWNEPDMWQRQTPLTKNRRKVAGQGSDTIRLKDESALSELEVMIS